MNIRKMTIEDMCFTTEKQEFDRKSARITAATIATPMIAFANADGGLLAIGIEDNGKITGIDDYLPNINEILRAPFDFCVPTIRIETQTIECVDDNGKKNHILLIYVPQSSELHANHRDEVYLRVGDKSKKLTFDERMQLMYAKGARYFEDEPVYGTSINDLDMNEVAAYCKRIGYAKTPEEYIRQNKSFLVSANGREELSGAAILLFGKEPQQYFKRARVRFIRYEGTEARVGAQMNVVKDKIFEGRILQIVEQSIDFVRDQIKEHTYLGREGKIRYGIRISRICMERNPKIAEVLHEYEYVREYGEGVDRLYNEMKEAGLPSPEYYMEAFMLHATLKNRKYVEHAVDTTQVATQVATQVTTQVDISDKITAYCKEPRKKSEIMTYCGYKNAKSFTKKYLKPLMDQGLITMTIPDKPNSQNQRYITTVK